ncbi:MAG: bifunctional phosphoribosyl-AMP cyclohydrolase/phosphoribosyl-ATP diphosphatase HisIE [Sphingobacteriales bacterium]
MKIDFEKSGGLVPAVIQDANTHKVLMLGYMNQEAFDQTMSTGKVTFFSRSKNRLWMKGEESGNFLELKSMALECDNDSLLIKAIPIGPVCHTGADTCWGEKNHADDFLTYLEGIIELRKHSTDGTSYVKSLFERGLNKIAQKLGEEAVEMIIEAKDDNHELFINEAADLLFHYLILLNRKGFSLQDIKEVLRKRHSS